MAFSLPESVHRIAPPASSLFGKLLHPRKAKRYSFHPYRLMFIFCQRRRHDCRRAFSLLESMHGIISPASSLFGKLLHPRKAKRYSFHPYRLMFIFCQRRRHDCRRAFSLLESVHRIISPVQTIPTLQTYSESCYIHENQSGTVFTHTACCLFFPNADGTTTTWRFLYSNLCMELFRQRQAYQAAASHTKQKRYSFHHTA